MDKLKINNIPLNDHLASNAIIPNSKNKKNNFSNILNTKISLKSAEPKTKEEQKIWKSAQDFEAFFLSQLFSQMRKTVPKNDLFGNKKREELFQGLLDEEVCKNLAKGKGLGLAEMLYKQLTPQNEKNMESKQEPNELTDLTEKEDNRG